MELSVPAKKKMSSPCHSLQSHCCQKLLSTIMRPLKTPISVERLPGRRFMMPKAAPKLKLKAWSRARKAPPHLGMLSNKSTQPAYSSLVSTMPNVVRFSPCLELQMSGLNHFKKIHGSDETARSAWSATSDSLQQRSLASFAAEERRNPLQQPSCSKHSKQQRHGSKQCNGCVMVVQLLLSNIYIYIYI